MKKTIKTILVVLLFVLVISSLGAEKVKNITWKWPVDDYVLFFRYQLDDENPSSWTIVDRSVNEVVTPELDPYVDHIFYIQLTYDGVNWTDSYYKVSKGIQKEEVVVTTPVVPEVRSVDETPVVVIKNDEESAPAVVIYQEDTTPVASEITTEVPEVVSSEVAVEKPVKVKKPLPPYFFTLSADFGGNMEIRSKDTYGQDTAGTLFYPKVGASLDFSFYQAPKNMIGIGIRFDFDDAFKPQNGSWSLSQKLVQEFSLAFDLLVSFDFGSLSAYGGVGFGINFGENDPGYKTYVSEDTSIGPIIKFIVGTDLKLGAFLLSFDVDGSWYCFSQSKEFILGAKVGLGFKLSNK